MHDYTDNEIEILRQGGRRLAWLMKQLETFVIVGITVDDIEQETRRLIKQIGATSATIGYKSSDGRGAFPSAVCVSVNDEVVHGIALGNDYVVKDGDVVSCDVVIVYQGLYVDICRTFAVGDVTEQHQHMILVAQGACTAAINAAQVGNTVNDIGHASEQVAHQNGLEVVRDLGGHGVGRKIHMPPFVPNFAGSGYNDKIREGMVLAIEPIITNGNGNVHMASDGWLFKTNDKQVTTQHEETVLVTKDGPEIIKNIRREVNRLGRDGWGTDDLEYLLDDKKTTIANYYFDIAIVALILLSCALYVSLTYITSGPWYWILFGLELILILFFTIEYLLRVHYEKKPTDYLLSWYGVADALAIIPFWFALFFPWMWSFEFLRILRIFKLYRFFQKYLNSGKIKAKISSRIVVTKMVFTMGALLFISSGFIYTFEAPHNNNINTFDDAAYFSLVTITTVGFGDITPESVVGRFVVMIVMLLSVFLVPVYLGSLLRSYMLQEQSHKKGITCQHCGWKGHDVDASHCKMCGEIIFIPNQAK